MREIGEKRIVDSGCSQHMTGNRKLFLELKNYDGGKVCFGNKEKGKIIGIGKKGNNTKQISNVALLRDLKFNLISVSQLCDKGYKVVFSDNEVRINDLNQSKTLLVGKRNKDIFVIDFNDDQKLDKCLVETHDDSILWHKRLAHVNVRNIGKLVKNNLVKVLTNLIFEKKWFQL